jgi:L-arabonate dehydrase
MEEKNKKKLRSADWFSPVDPKSGFIHRSWLRNQGCPDAYFKSRHEVGTMEIPEKSLKKGIKDMVRISDGRRSGTAFGTVVLDVSLESSIGSVLGLVKSGDYIVLDVPNRKLHLEVDNAELTKIKSEWMAPKPTLERGYVSLYTKTVQQSHLGADLDFLVGKSGTEVTRDAH